MANDFYLNEGEELEQQLDEEGAFYFTLMDFEQVIDKYGAEFVLKRMGNKCFEQLSEWFYVSSQPKKDVCKLLCS